MLLASPELRLPEQTLESANDCGEFLDMSRGTDNMYVVCVAHTVWYCTVRHQCSLHDYKVIMVSQLFY